MMKHSELPSPQYLRQVLDYDPTSGVLFWKERPREMFAHGPSRHSWNSRWAGKPAFRKGELGYMRGSISGKKLLAHRVIWAMHHDRWPEKQIDHINRDRSDNRIENLREVDASGNARNHSVRTDNTSGRTGVTWNARRSKWVVRVGRVFVGYFSDLSDASSARQDAEKRLGYNA